MLSTNIRGSAGWHRAAASIGGRFLRESLYCPHLTRPPLRQIVHMEELPERGQTAGDGALIESSRRLPTTANKLERISQHTKGLFDEITGWVDLRVKLVQVDLQEQFETKKIQIALGAAMGLLAFFALMFLLTTIALGLGALFGHPAWGFLGVTVLLVIIIGVLYMVMNRKVQGVEKKVSVEEEHLSHGMKPSGKAGHNSQ